MGRWGDGEMGRWGDGEIREMGSVGSLMLLLLIPIPDSRLPIPDSRFPVPYSLLPTPYSLLPTPYSLFPVPCSLKNQKYVPNQVANHYKQTITKKITMADYTQYLYIDKRVRYFDGEFLKDQDFIDEQKYHIDRQRRLDQFLRVSGVCDGLTLETSTNQVIVTPGTALDSQGRQIILSTNSPPIDLSSYRDQQVDLVISYQEEQSDHSTEGGVGSSGARRWHEKPNIQVAALGNVPEDSVVLARLAINRSGVVTPDFSVRQYSGVRLPSGNLSNGAITGPTLRSGGNSASSLVVIDGDLSVTGDTTVNGSLSFSSNTSGERTLLMEAPNSNNHRGDGTQGATGLVYRVQSNPPGGDPIFQVRSEGEGVRLFVEHDGWTGSRHNSAWFGGTRDNYFAGNVSIGTTDPGSSKLKVQGNLTVTGNATLESLTLNDSFSLGGSNTLGFGSQVRQMINLWSNSYGIGVQSGTQYFRTAKNFAWYKGGSHNDGELNAGGGTVQMVIKDGNVGIGTSDPGSSKLKVQGNLTVTGNATLESLTLNDNFSLGGSNTLGFGSQARQMINLYNQDYGIGIQSSTQYFRTNKNFAWYKGGSHHNNELNAGGGTVQMVIKDGNVGIGTTDPGSSKLKVQGNLTVTGNATLESLTLNDSFSLGGSNTLSFGSQVRQMINLWSNSYGIGVQSGTQYFRTAKNFAWYKGGSHNDGELNAGTNGTVQMVIKDGNVGIGRSDPDYKLDVISPNNEVAARFSRDYDLSAIFEAGNSGEAYVQFKNQTTGSNSWMVGMDDDEQFKITYGQQGEIRDNEAKLTVEQDGDVKISGSLFVSAVPYGDYQNAQWNSSNKKLYQDNSSARSKENIISLEDDFYKILTVEPKTYTRPNNPNRWEIGYIAEEFNEIGLNKLVYYNEEGLPESINYRKISMYLVEVIKDMAHRSSNYEQRINQLELQLNQLVSDD
ncbi:MAG: tail fiber domain-containing protein [Moorea sp. SIOASIH]|uniref:tail fiber domain-containing protein n=1 Tax=Moorena sp. SIOASIH TaxID=2607817 RepID=UPI0013BD6B1B|nr:tail fiber domain-containing protein [Moorena sp. SIOASIH]NEO37723.1 tail fiber domain-containing protein [Moorena sp. SIOASIH]